MKHIIIGTALILFAVFATPAYFEPSDIVVSSGWIAATTAALGPELASVVIPLWMAAGYIALLFGIMLLGTAVLRRFGLSRAMILFKHPYKISLIIVTICLIVSYYFYINL